MTRTIFSTISTQPALRTRSLDGFINQILGLGGRRSPQNKDRWMDFSNTRFMSERYKISSIVAVKGLYGFDYTEPHLDGTTDHSGV